MPNHLNTFSAIVEGIDRDHHYAWLRIGHGRVACRLHSDADSGETIAIRIRPGNILLSVGPPGRLSAQNILPGTIKRIKRVPEGVYVTVDAGFDIVALVTQRAATNLGLRRGVAVYVIFKANSIEIPIPIAAPVRVSLQGKHGRIEERYINLLRAIDSEGSLSQAAKAIGITYRSAWMWAEAMNEAWGKLLLKASHGGTGGGGAWLTSEGRALLAYVDSVESKALHSRS